jgi:hypothetical protein
METTIAMLTGATPAKLAELGAQGVTSGQDLSIITYDDMMAMLPQSGLLARRKLSLVGDYIGRPNGHFCYHDSRHSTIPENAKYPGTHSAPPNRSAYLSTGS